MDDAIADVPAAPGKTLVAGSRVRVTRGPWMGCVGVVHKLSASVGGGRTSVVQVDPMAPGESESRFVPRNRLVVVENQDIEPALGSGTPHPAGAPRRARGRSGRGAPSAP